MFWNEEPPWRVRWFLWINVVCSAICAGIFVLDALGRHGGEDALGLRRHHAVSEAFLALIWMTVSLVGIQVGRLAPKPPPLNNGPSSMTES